jgi:hypothetical protein
MPGTNSDIEDVKLPLTSGMGAVEERDGFFVANSYVR